MRLQLANSSFNEIARELGLSHSTVLDVSNSRGVSMKVAQAIAEKIGSSPDELWPGKYPSTKKGQAMS
ncbi:helix-turn-helix domain-containing protein [Cognatiyoonia sp. IB215446]|uniref:helix-turn-helix domain-containing protein n=1 Tax=Cognatiyoonia sp. IB215446 TaxID=3097355 RepID=UPI002A16F3F0|nr:helix-turn-helix domain-containing protein [Cognatiyoonia sp. IB215446]MDX8347400.1 helix-turn-helix domain-containing protein [Cognatiyoonia sp. IB215446]